MCPTHQQLTPPASTSTIGQALPQGGHPHRQLPPAHARPRRRHLRCVCDQWHRAMVVDRLTYVCVSNLTQTNRDGRPKGPPTEEGTYLMTRAHKRGVVAHPTLHNRHTKSRNHTSTHVVSHPTIHKQSQRNLPQVLAPIGIQLLDPPIEVYLQVSQRDRTDRSRTPQLPHHKPIQKPTNH